MDYDDFEPSPIKCSQCEEGVLDEECYCRLCGFDAAEAWHLNNLERTAKRNEY